MTILTRLQDESGLATLLQAPRDAKVLCIERFVRLFAYGSTTLVLILFLSSLGIPDSRIGLFLTLTLLGDVLLSFLLTLFADGIGRRRVLAVGALLMTLSGAVFSVTSNYWLLVLASVFGVISPSGSEIGPFRAIEESTIAQLTPKDVLTDFLVWYELIASAGAALGILTAGGIVQALERRNWAPTAAYRAIFVVYGVLGLTKFGLNYLLSDACEPAVTKYDQIELEDDESEDDDRHDEPQKPSLLTRALSLLPAISPVSQQILKRLCLLFGIDSFASGLVAASWITYFFERKFSVQPAVLGTIFFVTNIVASGSNLIAAPLAKRIGLIKTMVFTHLPSALFLAAIPVPSNVGLATTFLVLRHCTSSMDRAPRQAFLAAAVLSSERTAVMGFVNVLKTLTQSAGPLVTGWLAGSDRFWMVFLIAGGLKASYDLFMLKLFVGFKGREEVPAS